MVQKCTVKVAAGLLGMSPQAVRTQMRRKKLPIGVAYDRGGRWTYYIYSEWLQRFLLGNPVEMNECVGDKNEEVKKCEIIQVRKRKRR